MGENPILRDQGFHAKLVEAETDACSYKCFDKSNYKRSSLENYICGCLKRDKSLLLIEYFFVKILY